jgi:histidine kinase
MVQGNYKFSKANFNTANTMYYGATDDNGCQVLIEVSKNPYPTLEDLVGLKNDFEITSHISIPGVLANRELIRHQSGIAIVKEFFEGSTLSEFLEKGAISIEKFLGIALKITGIIHELHVRHIVHRDINADNIFISKDFTKVNLSNFSIATQFIQGQNEMRFGDALKGSLTHISPEQTGRMNRCVDYRTDLYSLGVTFYQMLCGKLPFEYTDAMELVHAHIARQPAEPNKLNPDIPKAISDMVMKLLAKNAEDRYQSAGGLKADLQEGLQQLTQNGVISEIEIAAHDHSPVLCISEKLYGRKEEIGILLEAFERCRDNTVEMVLVAGYSGIGKTRLINEIHKPIADRSGYFCSGKFDQFNRDIPYSAIGQAFGSLIRQFLGESNEQINQWKETILHALQGSGQVLTDIIPELEMLLGKQPQLLKLGPVETKTRLFNTFENFLQTLGSEKHPLVIFIDDLQWADSGSFDLVHNILTGPAARNVLLIGAYRDNEVSSTHLLMRTLDRVHESDPGKVHTIFLKELDKAQVNRLVADTLRLDPESTTELSALIYNKTHGNPFFIRQFIQKLNEDNLIFFDPPSAIWQWNQGGISKMNVTDNVVDLLVSKLRKLSPEAQELLRLASCIGNNFDIETLSIVSEKNESETAFILWDAVQEGFINPIGRLSKHTKDELWLELGFGENKTEHTVYKFQHDKIQQAAYSLIPDEQKKPTNLKIGRLLLQKLSESEVQEHLFNILTLLNFSAELISNEDEKLKVAKLNLIAGKKAKNSNAYLPALNSFKAGMALMANHQSDALYYDLLFQCSECEYLCGNFEESEKLYEIAFENAQGNLNKAFVCVSKMKLYENTVRFTNTIEIAQQGLHLLGTEMPVHPTWEEVEREFAAVKKLLGKKTIAQLENNTAIPSQEIALTQKIHNNLFSPAYLTGNKNLLAFFICRMVQLAVIHGNTSEAATAYAMYGYISCTILHEYKRGYQYSRLAIALNYKFDDKTLRAKVFSLADGCVALWSEKFANNYEKLRIAFDLGIETNDLVWSGYAAGLSNTLVLFMGEQLGAVVEKHKIYFNFARQAQSQFMFNHCLSLAPLTFSLRNNPADLELWADYLDVEVRHKRFLDFAAKSGAYLPLTTFYICNGALLYYFKKYQEAYENLELAIPIISGVKGLITENEHNYYHSLSMVALLKNGHADKENLLAKIQANQAILLNWSKNAPDNFKAKYILIEAELAVYHKKNAKAANLFTEAINVASTSGLLHISSLVYERMGEYYFSRGFNDLGNLLMRNAWLFYREWGANAKVHHLEELYPQLMQMHDPRPGIQIAGANSFSSIDIQSIFKASTSISGEVVFEKLLEKLLKLVIENAGAEKGCIIMVRNTKLVVEAIGDTENEGHSSLVNTPIENAEDIAHSIVQRVYHTGETLILNRAVNDVHYANDPYISNTKPKSILCMPVLQHGKCLAILYLENNLTADAFTPARLEVLNLLSGQIAISLENAELYQNLEQKVNERTETIEKQKVEIEKEKFKSDSLLLNILPFETAEELKNTGSYKPRRFDSVSIMFTDFEGFTKLSEKMTTEELVEMIDYCYKAFDIITTRNNIEKIKTIGDAYMCVGGLPVYTPDHAINTVNAAIEMASFIEQFNNERKIKKLPFCRIRIGVHTGPVSSGVVGSKKFAYDIWGDAVNTAQRMEHASEGGKINISNATYELVKDHFNCAYRGKISVKSKGDIDMYFVNPLPVSAE